MNKRLEGRPTLVFGNHVSIAAH